MGNECESLDLSPYLGEIQIFPNHDAPLERHSRNFSNRIGRQSQSDSTPGGIHISWNDSNDSGEFDASQLSLRDWMSQLPKDLRSKPIWSLTLPGNNYFDSIDPILELSLNFSGSHDSGAYALETKDGIAPDKPDLRKKWWWKYFRFLAFPIIRKWTITQRVDIKTQLENGIRYFDFRAAPKSKDDSLYFVHGLYGPKIISMCSDIKDFLSHHQREVVVIHIQHFYDTKYQQEKALLQEMLTLFDAKVCPYFEHIKNPSLDLLESEKHQVFLFYPGESRVQSPYLWPSEYLPNPWANTTKIQILKRFLTHHVHHRSQDRFFVTQGVLTPDDSFVKRYLYSSLYSRCVVPCNKTLCDWLEDQSAGPKGPNIVMIDFVEWNDYQIPKSVILMNYKMLVEQSVRSDEKKKSTATRTESNISTDSGFSDDDKIN